MHDSEDKRTELLPYRDTETPREEPEIKRTTSANAYTYKASMFEYFKNTPTTNILENFESKYPDQISNYYMLISIFLMSLNALSAELLQDFPVFEILLFRSLFVFGLLMTYIHKCDRSISLDQKEHKSFIIFQSFLFFLTASCYIGGIAKLPLSEAIAILSASPMFIGLLDFIVRGAVIGGNELICLTGGVFGIIMIIRPQFNDVEENYARLIGGILCILHAVFNAFGSVVLKVVTHHVPPLAMLTYASFFSFFLSCFGGIIEENWSIPSFGVLLGMICMAIFFFGGQFFVIKSIQVQSSNQSGNVAILNYLQILLALTFDVVIIGYWPDFWSLVGTILVVTACIIITLKFR